MIIIIIIIIKIYFLSIIYLYFSYNNLSLSKGVLKKIIEAATAETTVQTLCRLGDDLIDEETRKVYKKEKELKKGIY